MNRITKLALYARDCTQRGCTDSCSGAIVSLSDVLIQLNTEYCKHAANLYSQNSDSKNAEQ